MHVSGHKLGVFEKYAISVCFRSPSCWNLRNKIWQQKKDTGERPCNTTIGQTRCAFRNCRVAGRPTKRLGSGIVLEQVESGPTGRGLLPGFLAELHCGLAIHSLSSVAPPLVEFGVYGGFDGGLLWGMSVNVPTLLAKVGGRLPEGSDFYFRAWGLHLQRV